MKHSASWVKDLFAAIDRKDAEGFAGFLAEDAQFRFGNAEPVRGRAAVCDAVAEFFSSIKCLSHRLDNTWAQSDAVICEGTVTYTRHDDSQVALPFVDVFHMDGEQIGRYLIYMDIAPLFAAA